MELQEYIEQRLTLYFIKKLLHNSKFVEAIKDFPQEKLGSLLLFRYYISYHPSILIPVTDENRHILEYTLIKCFNKYINQLISNADSIKN